MKKRKRCGYGRKRERKKKRRQDRHHVEMKMPERVSEGSFSY